MDNPNYKSTNYRLGINHLDTNGKNNHFYSLKTKLKKKKKYQSDSSLDQSTSSSSSCNWSELIDNTRKELAKEALLYMLHDTVSPRYGTVNYKSPCDKRIEYKDKFNDVNYKSPRDKRIEYKDKFNDEYYMLELYDMLDIAMGGSPTFHQSPAPITSYMYIGGYEDAKNISKLKKIGITHVVNMAAFWEDRSHNPYPAQSGVVSYEAHNSEDNESYPILMHFPGVRKFIDRARWTGGKVLVHCAMGINRSAVMCCAYLMDGQKMKFLDAVKRVHETRGTVLRNRAFQQKLLAFARERGYL